MKTMNPGARARATGARKGVDAAADTTENTGTATQPQAELIRAVSRHLSAAERLADGLPQPFRAALLTVDRVADDPRQGTGGRDLQARSGRRGALVNARPDLTSVVDAASRLSEAETGMTFEIVVDRGGKLGFIARTTVYGDDTPDSFSASGKSPAAALTSLVEEAAKRGYVGARWIAPSVDPELKGTVPACTQLRAQAAPAACLGGGAAKREVGAMSAPMQTPLSALGEAALEYAAREWKVFPLQPGTKDPFPGGHGHLDATTDPDLIRRWWTHCPDANIGLNLVASGLMALDPDLYKPECEWHGFVRGRDLPETLVQRTARGGLHYIFAADASEAFPGDLCAGVEIKRNGYIVLEPSVFECKPYIFDNDADPAPVPDWVPRIAAGAAADRDPDSFQAHDLIRLMVALDRIKNCNRPWEEWNRIGMALWAATAGSDAGRQAFHSWSSRSDKYDEHETEKRWRHYQTSPPNKIGAGTIFHMAEEALFAGLGAGAAQGEGAGSFDAGPDTEASGTHGAEDTDAPNFDAPRGSRGC